MTQEQAEEISKRSREGAAESQGWSKQRYSPRARNAAEVPR
jgi:hypothetical protein